MKRTKIVLVGISILATIGGILAFKSNSAFVRDYCVRPFGSGPGSCTTILRATPVNAVVPYYTSSLITDCTTEPCNAPLTVKLIKE